MTLGLWQCRPAVHLLVLRHSRGLTLIELLTALTIAGILLALAIPAFRQITISNRLTTTANLIVETVMHARLEAIRRNAATQFCSDDASDNTNDTLGTACGTQAGAAYVLNTDASTTKLRDALAAPSGITVATGIAALRYGGQGLARQAGTNGPYTGLVADVYSDEIDSANHRCIYMTAGSIIASCTVTAINGACPANEPTTCQ